MSTEPLPPVAGYTDPAELEADVAAAEAAWRARAAGDRVQVDADAVARMVDWQLQRMPQEMRNFFARRKEGTERVMAHMIAREMIKLGWRIDAPVRDPRSAIVGRGMPDAD